MYCNGICIAGIAVILTISGSIVGGRIVSSNTATWHLESFSIPSRNSTLSIPPNSSSPNAQIVEIAHLAAYNTSTSLNTIQDAYLDTENPSNNISKPYIIYSNPQIALSNNQSNQEKNHPLDTLISEYTIPYAQNNCTSLLLVDVGIQEPQQPPKRVWTQKKTHQQCPTSQLCHLSNPLFPTFNR